MDPDTRPHARLMLAFIVGAGTGFTAGVLLVMQAFKFAIQ